MGRLWSEQEIDTWDESPPLEKLEECRRILVGKVLSNSSINLPAFQSVMQCAWRTDYVQITQQEMDIYVAKFKLESDKRRI